MSEPVNTGLVCPKCREAKVVILTPISPSETVLVYRCSTCGFQWVEQKPDLFKP